MEDSSFGTASSTAAIFKAGTQITSSTHQAITCSRHMEMATNTQLDRETSGGEMDEVPALEGERECQNKTGDREEDFSEVRRKRKRKSRATEMEVEDASLESVPKRPSFPPVDASTLLVCSQTGNTLHIMLSVVLKLWLL